MMRRVILLMTLCLMTAIGSTGCLSLFQPINKIEKRFSFIDMNAPALRLAKPVRAELLEKRDGQWVNIGVGEVPAGAYLKGRAPKKTVHGVVDGK